MHVFVPHLVGASIGLHQEAEEGETEFEVGEVLRQQTAQRFFARPADPFDGTTRVTHAEHRDVDVLRRHFYPDTQLSYR